MQLKCSLKRIFCAIGLAITSFGSTHAQQIPVPPTPPPTIFRDAPSHATAAAPIAAAPTQFSIGNPTDEEQLHLELINRARKDPNAEALRIIALNDPGVQQALQLVDLNLLKTQLAAYPATAPLSFNTKLINAARGHSQYQFDNAVQTHFEGTVDLAQRFTAAGYSYRSGGENVFAFASNVEYGHAGFEVDWSGDTSNGGMQTPPGHRNSIHTNIFTEIGIGVVLGTNTLNGTTVGPQVVTEDFGLPATAATYITGVAYYDLNGNNFYDLGEGLSGVTVTVDGQNNYAVTASSGGYSIPVPAGGSYTLHFQASGLSATTNQVTLNGTNNFKLDFTPAYVSPAVTTAPSITFAGTQNLYTFASVGGATGYRARVQALHTPVTEGAENGLANVSATTFGGYPVISTTVHATGLASFHLGHRPGVVAPGLQAIQLNKRYYVKTNIAEIDFQSRVGIATPNQVAHLEVSTDDGAHWTEIWSQAGTEVSGGADTSEKNFSFRTASLAAHLGKLVTIRFTFTVNGPFFPLPADTDSNIDRYAWFIDDILVSGASETSSPTITELDATNHFLFNPPSAGDYLLQFQALNGARAYPYGPLRLVTAQSGTPPVISFTNESAVSNGILTMIFEVQSGTVTPFALDSATSITGPWTTEPSAQITGPTRDLYTVTVPINGNRFYQIRAN